MQMGSAEIPVIGLVLPCFNEQDILATTAATLQEEVAKLVAAGLISPLSKIYFVDDGSNDKTWSVISKLVDQHDTIVGIKLTRNYGHQYALYAGLMEAEGDALISLDADLQDDTSVIEDMVRAFSNGSEVVFGVRSNRTNDGFFKRWSAASHYWLSDLMGIDTVRNHADYRLMSRKAVNSLADYREANLYLRGVVPLLGLQSSEVYYKRNARAGGESKYSLRKMVSLSLKGITSFSIMPLRCIALMGVIVFSISLALGGWAVHAAIWGDGVVPGWTSTVVPIYLLGGMQLLAIGIAGEYIGKTYMEVKNRPRYQIEKVKRAEDEN